MSDRRSLVLSIIAVPLALLGLLTGYVKTELADSNRFAERAVDALSAKAVRTAIAEQIAVDLLEQSSPALVASRPAVLTAVEAVLETDAFRRVLRSAARDVHGVLLEGETDALVELERAREVLLPAIQSAAPEIAERLPRDVAPTVSEIRHEDAATWVLRASDGASSLAVPLLIAAILALAGSIALAPDRRTALIRTGLIAAAGGVVGLAGLAALREEALSHTAPVGVLAADDVRAAAEAVWQALAGDLETWLMLFSAFGLLLATSGLAADVRIDREAGALRAATLLTGAGLPRWAHLLRGAALAAIGVLILLGSEPLASAGLYLAGGTFALLGLAELIAQLGARGRPVGQIKARRRWAFGLVAALLVTGIAITAWIVLDEDEARLTPADEIVACNGLAELCDRRLGEVAFAGTHNSMSAADRAGWFFANQTLPIPRQLEDGIRLLMLDPHYGVVDAQGRVRTDLEAEGTDRNRVARQLGADGVRAAEGLVTRLGIVPADGEREVFLCHTLCELGAQRMSAALGEIRGFLEANPTDVLILFIESSVDAAVVEEEFDRAGLSSYLAELDRDRPLPRLRELIETGRRIVVLDQHDGGQQSWYQPAFLFIQDTRTPGTVAEAAACAPGRGAPGSPMLLLNHWVDSFPPDPTENAAIGREPAILARAARCRKALGRWPNLIAVDFYDRTEVLDAVGELNRRLG